MKQMDLLRFVAISLLGAGLLLSGGALSAVMEGTGAAL